MVDFSIRPAVQSTANSSFYDKTSSAVTDLVQQIDNRTSYDAQGLSQIQVPGSELDFSSETDLFESAADWLDSQGKVEENDHILLGHDHWTLGFGAEVLTYTTSGGHNVHGGVHYIGTFVNKPPARSIGMQELLHSNPWSLSHCHGRYWLNGDDEVYLVSPMATSYVHFPSSGSDVCDTSECGSTSCGGGSVPDEFCGPNNIISGVGKRKCGNYANCQPNPYPGVHAGCPLHTKYLSELSRDLVEHFSQTDYSDR